jgi:signal transduction histidine kinase
VVLAAIVLPLALGGAVTVPVFLVAMLLTLAVNLTLVYLALEPLKDLERAATRVWRGDLGARVEPSTLADRDMSRIGGTLNILLDGLTSDRARMRRLAAQIISAQDSERARIARELHDSTAQTLTAAMLQLSAITRQATNPALDAGLVELRTLVSAALEEVRSLSHTIYPRVLDDLGIVAALEWLARQTREMGALDITVTSDARPDAIAAPAAAVLYRVAQESLRNIVQHAGATTVHIRLDATAERATLTIEDNGRGFDVARAEERRPGMGLFSIRERLSLVDGTVDIVSTAGRGTRLTAAIPLTALNAV